MRQFFFTLALSLGLAMAVTSPARSGDLDQLYGQAVQKEGRSEKDLKRDEGSKPAQVLAFAGIKPGMTVVDLFGGGGYFTELVSHVVGPKGKVFLHNNQAYMQFIGKELEQRLGGNRLPNAVRHDREADDLQLPTGGCDAIILVMGFHDIYFEAPGWKLDPNSLFDQIKKALKPDGVLLIIDHAAKAGTGKTDAQTLHRIEESFAKQDIAAHGFTLKAESQILRNPQDDYSISVFDGKVQGKTDRFMLLYKKS